MGEAEAGPERHGDPAEEEGKTSTQVPHLLTLLIET
jgi:hypothetical protein